MWGNNLIIAYTWAAFLKLTRCLLFYKLTSTQAPWLKDYMYKCNIVLISPFLTIFSAANPVETVPGNKQENMGEVTLSAMSDTHINLTISSLVLIFPFNID